MHRRNIFQKIIGRLSGKRKPTPNERLLHAVKLNDMEAVLAAIGLGADVSFADEFGYSDLPLRRACYYGHSEIAKLLIEKGADVNAPNFEGVSAPIRLAAKAGHMNTVASLLRRKAIFTSYVLRLVPNKVAKRVVHLVEKMNQEALRRKARKTVVRVPPKPLPHIEEDITIGANVFAASPSPSPSGKEDRYAPLEFEAFHSTILVESAHPSALPSKMTAPVTDSPLHGLPDGDHYILDSECYGVDTNVLFMDIERMERELDEEAQKQDKMKQRVKMEWPSSVRPQHR